MTFGDSVSYVLDAKDCIESVGDTWDRSALEHNAAELCAGAVVGHSLWSYLHGSTTSELYRLILARVRRGHQVVVPFDGSSPEVYREMHLELRPLPDGRVECTSRVSREAPHPSSPTVEPPTPSPSHPDHLLVCSWCSRIRVQLTWFEADEGVSTHRLFFQSPAAISHGLCHRCAPLVISKV